MRFFPKLTLIVLPLFLIPLVLGLAFVLARANERIHSLVSDRAAVELEFFLDQADQEHAILERLGIGESAFYVRSAQRAVLDYALEREVPGGALFAIDRSGTLLAGPAARGVNDLRLEQVFQPWGWTLGVTIEQEYVGRFFRETATAVALAILGFGIPAAALIWILARRLARPIERLEVSAAALARGELDARATVTGRDELASLAATFNRMAQNVQSLTNNLEGLVDQRTTELRRSLAELKSAQELLVRRERMASLGGLVAGVAHEINTPIGIGVTSSTYLKSEAEAILRSLEAGDVNPAAIRRFIEDTANGSDIVFRSLQRADELIRTFKNLAVDQTSDHEREFELCDYLHDIIRSLMPQLKQTRIRVVHECPDSITVRSYPGMFYQIVTNLILNSVTHAYPEDGEGEIRIDVSRDDHSLTIVYTDDGCGMTSDQVSRVFEPFFTTRLGQGGSGLGMSIVFNIVNNSLGGTIDLQSAPGDGVRFEIRIPNASLA